MSKQFKTFMTVKLGTGLKTADDFLAAFKEVDVRVSYGAYDMLASENFCVSNTETEFDLVSVTALDLGFEKPPSFENICERAQEFGLEKCPADVGPQLALLIPDGDQRDYYITMEELEDTRDEKLIFLAYRCENKQVIVRECSMRSTTWDIHHNYWIFVRPKEK